jgi:hypothetical protein
MSCPPFTPRKIRIAPSAQSGFFVFAAECLARSSHAALTSIFFAASCAAAIFGNASLSTPFLGRAARLATCALHPGLNLSPLQWSKGPGTRETNGTAIR